jgi:hypothetical protein
MPTYLCVKALSLLAPNFAFHFKDIFLQILYENIPLQS